MMSVVWSMELQQPYQDHKGSWPMTLMGERPVHWGWVARAEVLDDPILLLSSPSLTPPDLQNPSSVNILIIIVQDILSWAFSDLLQKASWPTHQTLMLQSTPRPAGRIRKWAARAQFTTRWQFAWNFWKTLIGRLVAYRGTRVWGQWDVFWHLGLKRSTCFTPRVKLWRHWFSYSLQVCSR